MRKPHHIADHHKNCTQCKKPFKYYWFDAEEMNGQSETMYGSDEGNICGDCKTKNNGGKPPLSLVDLNEIRRLGITREEYYKKYGY